MTRTYIAHCKERDGPTLRIVRVTSLKSEPRIREAVVLLLADQGLIIDEVVEAPKGAALDELANEPYKVHYLTVN